jgi:hypothetical protein
MSWSASTLVERDHARRAEALVAFLDGPAQSLRERLLLQHGQGQWREAAGVGALGGFGVFEGSRCGAVVGKKKVGFAPDVAALGAQRASLGVGGQRLQRLAVGTGHGRAQFQQRDAVFDLPGGLAREDGAERFRARDVAAVEPPEGFVDARFACRRLPRAPDADGLALQRGVVRAPCGQRERAQCVVAQLRRRVLAAQRHRFGELAVTGRDGDGVGHHALALGVAQSARRCRQPVFQLLQRLCRRDAAGAARDDQCVVRLRAISHHRAAVGAGRVRGDNR